MLINIIGGGLAGCEAACAAARLGAKVRLYEMKPEKKSPAHHSDSLCELVCSNSLKAERLESAAGLLKEEMRLLGSVVVEAAELSRVPAGGALAVDRDKFSQYVTRCISENDNIEVIHGEIIEIPDGITVIATGPLTSDAFSKKIKELVGEESLSFFDAAAPIVTGESIDRSIAFDAARYGRGEADYLNCPFDREQYEAFTEALLKAESAPLHEFDKQDFKVYEGCMPIEVMAKRGPDTMRFGPLKPVGIYDPVTGKRPYAVVQLRRENLEGTMFNLVGFQTNLKFGEQKRVFSMIPSLENAEFVRYGVMHRNTFINSPKILDATFAMKKNQDIFFAGQITGVEGYIESAASGILAGINAVRHASGKIMLTLPCDTMLGALANYISTFDCETAKSNFQPMGCNMGILPPSDKKIKGKSERYLFIANRAIDSLKEYLEDVL